ncbi:MAG: VWA domain-containing protein [Gammaproteobacteria bacterium]|nr:VWA domain-containing protein [Gammaproteobacteria bacterium]
MNNLVLILISSIALFISHDTLAAKPSVDAVVIMDSSGSMKKSDPDSRRKPAAKLFISLLNSEDRVSIMSFSDNGYPITYLNTLDNDKNLQLTLDATDKVSNKGIYTNIHAAVERAYKILSENKSERDPVIILLSDGKMDVGNDEKSQALSAQLIEETLPKLNTEKIKLYSIAFTENADKELLTRLSESTGGFCKVAENDEALHLAFTSIFEQSKQPDMLPLTENTFLADESIREITIVANKASPESKIYLQTPANDKFDASVKDKQIKWFISDTFDMITIKKPAPGEWKILFSDNNNKAYIVADMAMKTTFEFTSENDRQKIQMHAWLEKDDVIVTEATILDSTQAKTELSSPSDKITEPPMGLALNDESLAGVFISNYTPDENGTYFATITLKSQTFERQKTFSFNATYTAPAEEFPVALNQSTEAEKEIIITPKPNIEPEIKPETEPTAEPEPEPEEDTLKSILIFVVINIIIAIIGLSIFLLIKLKNSKKTEPETK